MDDHGKVHADKHEVEEDDERSLDGKTWFVVNTVIPSSSTETQLSSLGEGATKDMLNIEQSTTLLDQLTIDLAKLQKEKKDVGEERQKLAKKLWGDTSQESPLLSHVDTYDPLKDGIINNPIVLNLLEKKMIGTARLPGDHHIIILMSTHTCTGPQIACVLHAIWLSYTQASTMYLRGLKYWVNVVYPHTILDSFGQLCTYGTIKPDGWCNMRLLTQLMERRDVDWQPSEKKEFEVALKKLLNCYNGMLVSQNYNEVAELQAEVKRLNEAIEHLENSSTTTIPSILKYRSTMWGSFSNFALLHRFCLESGTSFPYTLLRQSEVDTYSLQMLLPEQQRQSELIHKVYSSSVGTAKAMTIDDLLKIQLGDRQSATYDSSHYFFMPAFPAITKEVIDALLLDLLKRLTTIIESDTEISMCMNTFVQRYNEYDTLCDKIFDVNERIFANQLQRETWFSH